MQSCIWSCRSWPLNPCEAAWQAKRLPVGTGTAAAGLTGTAGVDVVAGVGVAAGVVDCAKAAAAKTSEPAATTAVPVGNSILLATDIESGDAPALCERSVA